MKRIGVVGGGRFGTTLAECLTQRGVEVLFIDRDPIVVQRLSNDVAKAVQGDASDPETLTEAGFLQCDAVVVAIGTNVEASIMAVMSLKEMGVARVIAKASNDTHAKVLKRIGADQIVSPEKDRAERLARVISARSVLAYFEVAEESGIVEMIAPDRFIGRTLADLRIRSEYGLTVLAIRRASKADGVPGEMIIAPSGDDVIRDGDTVTLFGPKENLEKITK